MLKKYPFILDIFGDSNQRDLLQANPKSYDLSYDEGEIPRV